MSFGMVVSQSQVTLEIFVSCKLVPSDTGNLRRSRPGGESVANRSQSITCQSEVGRNVSWRSGRGRGFGAPVYADRLTNGVRGSRLYNDWRSLVRKLHSLPGIREIS